MSIPDTFSAYVPDILRDDNVLQQEWINDMNSVQSVYPQGQLVRVNRISSLKNIIKFVAQERSCSRAQLEIERLYLDHMIPTIYEELVKQQEDELALILKPYVGKLRCQYPDYHCPSPCGNPKTKRKI